MNYLDQSIQTKIINKNTTEKSVVLILHKKENKCFKNYWLSKIVMIYII